MFPPFETDEEAEWFYFDISKRDWQIKDGAPEEIQKKYKQYLDAQQYLKEHHYVS